MCVGGGDDPHCVLSPVGGSSLSFQFRESNVQSIQPCISSVSLCVCILGWVGRIASISRLVISLHVGYLLQLKHILPCFVSSRRRTL